MVDFSKAFNRMSHNKILSDLNIPTCALRLIISYLSNRSLCIRYHGAVSSDRSMQGGGPQGTLLIVLLFILQFNHAGDPCSSTATLPPGVYVDDLTMLEHIPPILF